MYLLQNVFPFFHLLSVTALVLILKVMLTGSMSLKCDIKRIVKGLSSAVKKLLTWHFYIDML